MRIAYVTNVRLPSERAHGHQVARVTDALAKLGHEVTILAPYRDNDIRNTYHDFHHADLRVKIDQPQKSFDPINKRWIPPVFKMPILNWLFRTFLKTKLFSEAFDVIYTRTPALLPFLLTTHIPVILELHTLPNRNQKSFVQHCNRCALVVCLTSPMQDELVLWGVEGRRVIVESDAVDADLFISAQPMHSNLPRPIIGYAGQIESMGMSKGVPELLDAISILRDRGFTGSCMIAGPPPKSDAFFQRLTSTPGVEFHGFKPTTLIPPFLSACDILVYPAPASNHPFYNRDTSPLKIFEYMATGKPIVTADLPPIRDVLDDTSAFFCKPGDPQDLARAIEEVMKNPQEAQKRATEARKRVERYTWTKRMERIMMQISLSPSPSPDGRGGNDASLKRTLPLPLRGRGSGGGGKILSIASARPNFVKLAAVHHALKDRPGVEHVIIHTGQHYDPMLSDVFFEQLQIAEPKHNLGIHGGTREEVIEKTKTALIPVLQKEKPDWVLVYGDVNGAVGGALATKELGIKLAHVEAGLRSGDLEMPEEHNRIAIDTIANLLLCSEQSGVDHLRKENMKGRVELVGNTMIDTLTRMLAALDSTPLPSIISDGIGETFAVATLHRPSNVDMDEHLQSAFGLLRRIAKHIPVVLPVHPRTKQKLEEASMVLPGPGVFVIEPLGYLEFIRCMSDAAFILTDSGGIQEEAVILGKRCFTLRKNTERPSTIESGSNVLIDIDKEEDRQKVLDFAANPKDITVKIPELWDGKSGERIADILLA